MNIQKWLDRVRYYDARIKANRTTLEELSSRKDGISSSDPAKLAIVGTRSDVDAIGVQLVKIDECAREIADDSDRLISAMQEILALCKRIENPVYRVIIQDRYVNRLTFDAIAESIGYSEYWVRVLHKRALAIAKRLLTEGGE